MAIHERICFLSTHKYAVQKPAAEKQAVQQKSVEKQPASAAMDDCAD